MRRRRSCLGRLSWSRPRTTSTTAPTKSRSPSAATTRVATRPSRRQQALLQPFLSTKAPGDRAVIEGTAT